MKNYKYFSVHIFDYLLDLEENADMSFLTSAGKKFPFKNQNLDIMTGSPLIWSEVNRPGYPPFLSTR